MSKTYKTDPYSVYLADPKKHKITIEEIHDHSRGECQLNPNPLKSTWRDRCYYSMIYTGKGTCGCNLCTDFYQRKWDRRKERHKGKKYTREFAKEYE